MPEDRPPEVSITLSPDQVRSVVRAAAPDGADSLASRIARELHASLDAPTASARPGHGFGPGAGTEDRRWPAAPSGEPRDGDRRLSQSLLRGLSVLACFATPPAERGVVELAAELGISPSTAHRYAQTLLELGLIERAPAGRKYRLPPAPARGADGS